MKVHALKLRFTIVLLTLCLGGMAAPSAGAEEAVNDMTRGAGIFKANCAIASSLCSDCAESEETD